VGGCVVATDLLLESATVQEQTQHRRIEKARRNLGLVDASSKNAPSAYKSVGCGSVGRVVSWPYINEASKQEQTRRVSVHFGPTRSLIIPFLSPPPSVTYRYRAEQRARILVHTRQHGGASIQADVRRERGAY
jgi:hypothetical protein